MRKLLSIAAIAAIAAMAFVPAASAKVYAKTTLTMDPVFLTNGGTMWSGKVVAPTNKKCASKRVVLLFKQRAGKDQKIGSTKAEPITGQVGYYWAFEKVGFAAKPSERYYVKATRTEKPACAPARSSVRSGPEPY